MQSKYNLNDSPFHHIGTDLRNKHQKHQHHQQKRKPTVAAAAVVGENQTRSESVIHNNPMVVGIIEPCPVVTVLPADATSMPSSSSSSSAINKPLELFHLSRYCVDGGGDSSQSVTQSRPLSPFAMNTTAFGAAHFENKIKAERPEAFVVPSAKLLSRRVIYLNGNQAPPPSPSERDSSDQVATIKNNKVDICKLTCKISVDGSLTKLLLLTPICVTSNAWIYVVCNHLG